MAIEFHCPQCSKLLRTADDKAGRTAKCPDCGSSIQVPGGGGGDSPYEFDDADTTAGDSSPPAESSAGMKPCPMCGQQIRAAAIRCRYCGETFGTPRRPRSRSSHLAPHRGGMILAFGILGWTVCGLFAPFAWVMGNTDLAEMQAGRMDPSGEGLTQAGKIIGMIQCILMIVGIVIVGVMMCAGVIAGR